MIILLAGVTAGEALTWSAGPTKPEERGRNLPPALKFIGSINSDLRSILAGLAPAWRGLPLFVGCSGNFTVERILVAQGLTDLHGNDVSLYSCALGAYLSSQPFRVEVNLLCARCLSMPCLDIYGCYW